MSAESVPRSHAVAVAVLVRVTVVGIGRGRNGVYLVGLVDHAFRRAGRLHCLGCRVNLHHVLVLVLYLTVKKAVFR